MQIEYTYEVLYDKEYYTVESIVEDTEVMKNDLRELLKPYIRSWRDEHFPLDKKMPLFVKVLDRRIV